MMKVVLSAYEYSGVGTKRTMNNSKPVFIPADALPLCLIPTTLLHAATYQSYSDTTEEYYIYKKHFVGDS